MAANKWHDMDAINNLCKYFAHRHLGCMQFFFFIFNVPWHLFSDDLNFEEEHWIVSKRLCELNLDSIKWSTFIYDLNNDIRQSNQSEWANYCLTWQIENWDGWVYQIFLANTLIWAFKCDCKLKIVAYKRWQSIFGVQTVK